MYKKSSFICPHCKIGAHQRWYRLDLRNGIVDLIYTSVDELWWECDALSACSLCGEPSLWKNGELVYPIAHSIISDPNEDLPDEIKKIYEEARSVFHNSSRSSAALLRLAMELMLTNLGYTQNRLVDKINSLLVSEGANEEIVLAAEIIRLYGNSSTHTGFIDLNEDKEAAEELFMVINLIAEHQYTRPKKLKALMDKLPEGKRKQIEVKLERL